MKMLPVIVFLGLIGLVIAANAYVFRAFLGLNYFEWYLGNAFLISLGASFLGLVWEGLTLRRDLISMHPALYLAGNFGLIGTLYHAVGTHLSSPKSILTTRGRPGYALELFFTLIVSALLMVIILIWLLVVAPLNYFVVLLCGAPARRELDNRLARAILIEENNRIRLEEIRPAEAVPKNGTDVSIGTKPFAFTQAVSAMVLWLAGMAHAHFFV